MKELSKHFMKVIKGCSYDEIRAIQSIFTKAVNDEMKFRKKSGEKIKLVKCKTTKAMPIPETSNKLRNRIRYIQFIVDQKWDYLFEDIEEGGDAKYYVYSHTDPTKKEYDLKGKLNIDGLPFYIGKGSGGRCYDLNRNQGHGLKLNSLLNEGFNKDHIVNIVKHGLTERQALALESKLIYLFKTIYEDPEHGLLYNLDTGRRPNFDEETILRSNFVIRKNSNKEKANKGTK